LAFFLPCVRCGLFQAQSARYWPDDSFTATLSAPLLVNSDTGIAEGGHTFAATAVQDLASAAATGKEQLALPAETALVFTLRAPVRME
jgi:hypothetical protein